MIKMSWALIGEHADEWTGADTQEGAAVLEARVRTAVGTSGMTAETAQYWHTTFLAPVVEAVRTEGQAAVSRGEAWSKAVVSRLEGSGPEPWC
ncbi:hypothetical protein OG819_16225 [Streptomyces sp. NBC_01549]|uniref:hypothetical protein n=1 Tax=Streptomyces sp. NBC_01549 TaxID=2975874 RepID=UPI00225173DD|nr:hypothetical protein [Streptomyces sp. NBC_01549]MCX4591231.1 hypothetical protein [Streptomyces sp. NBC_01549]